jgi:hypothetical protein
VHTSPCTYVPQDELGPCAARVKGTRGVYCSQLHIAQFYIIPCISALPVGPHNRHYCYQVWGHSPWGRHRTPTAFQHQSQAGTVDGGPDIVKPLPDYSALYRDRSLKTTRKPYRFLHTDSSHHAICPFDECRAYQCDPAYLAI